MKKYIRRIYRNYEAEGSEADELRIIVAEALDEHLNCEIEVMNGVPASKTKPSVEWEKIDQQWFDDGGKGEEEL